MPKNENYLETFTPKELMEVVINPEDWHPADVKQAKQILKQKGVTKRDIAEYKKRLEEKAKNGERANMGVLALGFVSALLGGILGILIGYYLMTSKRNVGGKQVMHYDEPTRKLGKIILALGAIGAVVWTVLYLTR